MTTYTRARASFVFRGDQPSLHFTSDGCTWAPDVAWNGADLYEACRWHDWAYTIGGSEKARKQADHDFLHNLKQCGCPWPLARFYFHRVRFWGTRHFGYWHGFKPPAIRNWLAILVNRYRE